jgi:tRNA(Ile)-lysidine synthetase-like protein
MMWYSIPMNPLIQFQQQTCVLLVSGGPDSMALAHMAVTSKLNVVLVSVNYHKREHSDQDIALVQVFALKHGCPLYIFDAYDLVGNFQAKARDFRYQKAMEVARSVDAKVIMSAHHLDDHLETYLWQIKRNHKPLYYGIKPITWLQEFMLVRPCLEYSKEELINYNHTHDVDYIIDESNASLVYTRNVIRQEIQSMNQNEKLKLLETIKHANIELKASLDSFLPQFTSQGIDMNWFKTLEKDDQHACLRVYLNQHKATKASQDALEQFTLHCDHKDYHQFFSPVYLLVHHGWIKVFHPPLPLFIEVKSLNEWNDLRLDVFGQPLQSLNLTLMNEDFPLIIRHARPKDRMQIKVGRKKVFNWFSEKKIPRIVRQTWPLIQNAERQIIYVKEWGADMVHRTNNNPTFMIK